MGVASILSGSFEDRSASFVEWIGRNVADHARDLWFEKSACVVICAYYGLSGSLYFTNTSADPEIAMDPGASAAIIGIGSQLIIGILIVLLLLRRFHHVMKAVTTLQWGGVLAVIALASVAWSQDPSITMKRALSFLLATIFALYFASRFDLKEQLSILWWTMVLLASASLLFCVVAPSYGLDPTPGRTHDWRGVFSQKQGLGRAMVLGIALTMCMGRISRSKLLALLLFSFLLALSGSRTFWLVGLNVFVLAYFMHFLKRYDRKSRGIILSMSMLLSITAITLGVIFAPDILALLGRDATLTGRTDIWRAVWQAILKRPLLGYGLGGFWIGLKGEAVNVMAAVQWGVPHAHNGFLELMLELGGAGLAIFGLSYFRGCSKAWRLIRSPYMEQAIWPVFVLFLVLACDLDENSLISFNGIFWPLFIMALVNLELCDHWMRMRQWPPTPIQNFRPPIAPHDPPFTLPSDKTA